MSTRYSPPPPLSELGQRQTLIIVGAVGTPRVSHQVLTSPFKHPEPIYRSNGANLQAACNPHLACHVPTPAMSSRYKPHWKHIVCRGLALSVRKAAFHISHVSPGAVQAAGVVHALMAPRANRWATPLRAAKLQQPAPSITRRGCLQQVQTERHRHIPTCRARTELGTLQKGICA